MTMVTMEMATETTTDNNQPAPAVTTATSPTDCNDDGGDDNQQPVETAQATTTPITKATTLDQVYKSIQELESHCPHTLTQRLVQYQRSLTRAVQYLPDENSLFAVPLHNNRRPWEPPIKPLQMLNDDFANRQKSLIAKTVGGIPGWSLLLATLQRKDTQWGCYIDDTNFDVQQVQQGAVTFQDLIYVKDGNNAMANKEWISKQLNLKSVNATEKGMILASEDEAETSMWGQGVTDDVSLDDKGCSSDEARARDITYTAWILVAYPNQDLLERLCETNLHQGINWAVKDHEQKGRDSQLLLRLFAFLDQHRPQISSNDYHKLLEALRSRYTYGPNNIMDGAYFDHFETLMRCLAPQGGPPPNAALSKILAGIMKERGWKFTNGVTITMEVILHDLERRALSMEFDIFFSFSGLCMALTNNARDDMPTNVWLMLGQSIESWKKMIPWVLPERDGQSKWQPDKIADQLIILSGEFGWEQMGPIAQLAFARSRKENSPRKLDHLRRELEAFDKIQKTIPSANIIEYKEVILNEFIEMVTKGGLGSKYVYLGDLVKELLKYGTAKHFKSLEKWVPRAPIAALRTINNAFRDGNITQVPRSPLAKNSFVETLKSRWLIEQLRDEEAQLKKEVAGGMPTFSWKMPNAKTRSPLLDAFLQSDKQGTEYIIVGGGLKFARELANPAQPLRLYCQQEIRDDREVMIHNGYSASIIPADTTGKRAAILVTKTKDWHDAQLVKYHENVKKLGEVQEKLKANKASTKKKGRPAKRTSTATTGGTSRKRART